MGLILAGLALGIVVSSVIYHALVRTFVNRENERGTSVWD